MTINNKGNLFVFEVGPSVKFVSAIKDAIFKKKMGVIFLLKIASLMAETNFTLGPTSKKINFLCYLWS